MICPSFTAFQVFCAYSNSPAILALVISKPCKKDSLFSAFHTFIFLASIMGAWEDPLVLIFLFLHQSIFSNRSDIIWSVFSNIFFEKLHPREYTRLYSSSAILFKYRSVRYVTWYSRNYSREEYQRYSSLWVGRRSGTIEAFACLRCSESLHCSKSVSSHLLLG